MEIVDLWVNSISDQLYEVLGPQGLKVVTLLYFAGMGFKILSLIITYAVNQTKTDVDNKAWNRVQSSIIYKIIAWVLDLILRLRLPKSKDGKKR